MTMPREGRSAGAMIDHENDVNAVTPTPAIINLIESADFSFEIRVAARDHLLRACSLTRAQKLKEPTVATPSGGLLVWQVNRAFNFIEARLSSAIQVGDVATEVNLSVSHFFRSFKATVGMTPREYITRRRIEAAQKLMRTTAASFSDIAIECGLCDQSHLCRIFRRFVGESPNAWRKANAATCP
jgi:AraC family transcriptional regulator